MSLGLSTPYKTKSKVLLATDTLPRQQLKASAINHRVWLFALRFHDLHLKKKKKAVTQHWETESPNMC